MKAARIALIHAVPMAIGPVAAAFDALWPEAERINLLDDSLSVDRQRAGALTPAIAARIAALPSMRGAAARTAFSTPARRSARRSKRSRAAAIPVHKPNEAMFDEALATGKRIGMLATFPPSVEGMEAEFRAQAGAGGATVATICVPDAMSAAQRGDMATHNALLVEAARGPDAQDFDALMLAQFSMAPASAAVQAVARCPVLTSPASAVRRLRQALA